MLVGETKRIAVITSALDNNGDRVQLDPATLSVTVVDPLGATATYTYGVDAEVVQAVEANYYIDVVATSPGTWRWLWGATGNVDDVGTVVSPLNGSFLVEAAPVAVAFVVDDDVGPVAGALVQVFLRGYLTAQGQADSNGNTTIMLKPGTYMTHTYTQAIPRVAFAAGGMAELVVTDAVTVGISGIRPTIDAPTPDVVTLFGHVTTLDGSFIATDITVESLPQMSAMGSGPAISTATTGITRAVRRVRSSQTDGYWSVEVVVGLMIRVRIPALNYDQTFRVPNGTVQVGSVTSWVNIADVRPDPQATTSGIRTNRGAPGSSLVT